MIDRFFSRVFELAWSHKRHVLLFVAVVTAAALAGLSFIQYEGNIDLMLPGDKDVARSMQFLRDSNLSDKIIVSLALTKPDKDKKDLFKAVDDFAISLQPPLFTKVVSGVSVGDAMDEFSVLQYGPQIITEEELASLDGQINKRTVEAKLKQVYLQSFRPESIFTSSFSRTDPLGIKALVYGKLKALPSSMGYNVDVEDGHFISRDGRHAMLIVQTSVPMTDSTRCKELVRVLDEKVKQLPDFASADVIAGHLHTVSNEQVITRDITVASIVASIGFLLLFLFLFRDARALFVIVFPLFAVIWAIFLTAFIEDKLSYLVIGFGTAIVGISDYGLIVYIAMKRGTDYSQMGKLAKLVFIDAITTIFSFVVLFFSEIRGYHQLALFSILCLIICLVFSLFVLPLTLSWKGYSLVSDPTIGDRLKKIHWPAGLIVAIWSLITVIFLVFSFSIRFDSDVKKLDASGPEVLRAERAFHDVWGGKTNQAIFIVTGKNLEEAMVTNDQVFKEAVKTVGSRYFTSLALFWPSEHLRKENRDRWDRFWKQGKEQKLKGLIGNASAAYGFSDRAFSPFFEGLYNHGIEPARPGGFIAQLHERFVVTKNGETRIMSFFPDEQQHLETMTALTKKYPGSFIVSEKALSASLSDFTAREMNILAPLAVIFNLVLSWLFFRSWKETLIALLPLFTGVIWLLGIMSLFNMSLNVVNVIAGVIVSGVIVDYGLGITYEYRHNLHFGTVMAMTLSALSNIIGAGALLFARHPALHSTGLAMVICMVTGYLCSVIVVPSFCSLISPASVEQAR